MELREAIDVISGRKDAPISDKIEASSVINYAVVDGTLIPADQTVKVKPLEWRDGVAPSLVGTYTIHQTHVGVCWYALLNGTGVGTADVKTENDAKAAAQADYEKRIRSTLIPAAQNSHSDDEAVDRFAVAMKAKLAKKRADGRGGWDNPDKCSAEFLSKLLREHVEKGDPLDVGNLAMMLHQRGDHIHPADQCFEVKEEGFDVFAIQTYNKEHDRWDYPVPLSEALSIRSAEEVRRESFREALDLFESRPDAVKVIRAMIKGGDDE